MEDVDFKNSSSKPTIQIPPVEWHEKLHKNSHITVKEWQGFYKRWAERCEEVAKGKTVTFKATPYDKNFEVMLSALVKKGDKQIPIHSIKMPYRLLNDEAPKETSLKIPKIRYQRARSLLSTKEVILTYNRPAIYLKGISLHEKTLPKAELPNEVWEELVGVSMLDRLDDEAYGEEFYVVESERQPSPYIYRGGNNKWFLTHQVKFGLAKSQYNPDDITYFTAILKTNYKLSFKEESIKDLLSPSSYMSSRLGLYKKREETAEGEIWECYDEELNKKLNTESTFSPSIDEAIESIQWGIKSQTDLLKTLRLTPYLNSKGETSEGLFSQAYKYANQPSAFRAKTDKQAVLLFLKAAAKGNADAQNWLGEMQQHGRIAGKITVKNPQNDNEVISWYRMAAKKGHPQAQDNLAVRYHYKREKPDFEKALFWLNEVVINKESSEGQRKKAMERIGYIGRIQQTIQNAEKGDPKAQVEMVRMYQSGSGLRDNNKKAQFWNEKVHKNPRSNSEHKKQANNFFSMIKEGK